MIEFETTEELDAFVAALKLCKKDFYFDAEDQYGNLQEWEADTWQKAEEHAQEAFAEDCEADGDMENGELSEDTGYILVQSEDGTLARCPIMLSYTHYHGDFAEHCPMGRGGL